MSRGAVLRYCARKFRNSPGTPSTTYNLYHKGTTRTSTPPTGRRSRPEHTCNTSMASSTLPGSMTGTDARSQTLREVGESAASARVLKSKHEMLLSNQSQCICTCPTVRDQRRANTETARSMGGQAVSWELTHMASGLQPKG